MRYLTASLPVNPAARALRLAHERAQGGAIYARPDGTIVLVRATWTYPSAALVSLDTLPVDWVEITD